MPTSTLCLNVSYIGVVKRGTKMLNKQINKKSFPKFLERVVDQGQHSFHVFKKYFLISAFAILMVSIQCVGGAAPSPSSVVSTPPDDGSGQFDPICTNGTPSTVKVSDANTEKCVSCEPGFDINGDICGGFDPICTNGVASTTKVPDANTEKCVSCDNYYALKSDKTCTPVSVETLAGTVSGFMDGASNVAQLKDPRGVAVYSDVAGDVVYVADKNNHSIRKITSGGVVSTLAGTSRSGFMDGAGNVAQFSYPHGVAVDSSGKVYVADSSNHRIREITSGGVVSTLAGSGTAGFMDGAGNVAQFNSPVGVAVDVSGNIYVADKKNHRIRKITTDAGGVVEVETLAGTGGTGFMNGAGNVAQFNKPNGVAVDVSGNVYVADSDNNRIRKITTDAGGVVEVETLAGTGSSGSTNGAGNVARFNEPKGIAVDVSGNVYVADSSNHRIREITSGGVVSTLAGSGGGFMNGAGNIAKFNKPYGVAVDGLGNLYVGSTWTNNRIRKLIIEPPTLDPICTNGTPSTVKVFFANAEKCASCNSGFSLNGEICREQFDPICTNGTPSTVKVFFANTEKCAFCDSGFDINGDICGGFDPTCTNGNPSTVKLPTEPTQDKCTSCDNYYIFKSDETCASVTVSKFTSSGLRGFKDGASNVAKFSYPEGVAVYSDVAGDVVYVADKRNNRIRKITTDAGGVVEVETLAGTASSGFVDSANGPAQFDYLSGVAVDSSGNVYVADANNHSIRKITSGGVVSTFAGTSTVTSTGIRTGSSGFVDSADSADGSAKFKDPKGVAVDGSGNVYVADMNNHSIRKITSGGVVSTLAGTGSSGFVDSADSAGGVAKFNKPRGVAVDGDGNVYVADSSNHSIRKITSGGVVSTLAGTGSSGSTNGAGNVAKFNDPRGVAVDSSGNVYVADTYNYRIRKITTDAAGVVSVSTLAGGAGGASGDVDGAGNVAKFKRVVGVAVDSDGNLYVGDSNNYYIRKITIPQ